MNCLEYLSVLRHARARMKQESLSMDEALRNLKMEDDGKQDRMSSLSKKISEKYWFYPAALLLIGFVS